MLWASWKRNCELASAGSQGKKGSLGMRDKPAGPRPRARVEWQNSQRFHFFVFFIHFFVFSATRNQTMSRIVSEKWRQSVADAFNASDAKALGEALDEAIIEGRHDDFRWDEGMRLAANQRKPELFMAIARRWSSKGEAVRADGRSWLSWVALNAENYGMPGYEENTAMAETLMGWASLDQLLTRPEARHFDSENAREKSMARQSARMGWRLIHAAAQANNLKLLRRLVELGANLDGCVGPLRKKGAVPANDLPLAAACRSGSLEAAKFLARSGGRMEMPKGIASPGAGLRSSLKMGLAGSRDAQRTSQAAGSAIRAQILDPTADPGRAIEWARFALETLAPPAEPASVFGAGRQDAVEAMLGAAQLARDALVRCAGAAGAPRPDFERMPSLAAPFGEAGRGARRINMSALDWISPTARMEAAFFRALGLRDARLMEEWALNAGPRSSGGGAATPANGKNRQTSSPGASLRVAGLPPAAWVVALSLAEEARAFGAAESLAQEQEAKDGAQPAQDALFVFAPPASRLIGALAKSLGPESVDEPIGALLGLRPLGVAALCNAPKTARSLLAAGADPQALNGDEGACALKCAALGRSERCSEDLAGLSTVDAAMGAALVWAMAKNPRAARQALQAAGDAEASRRKNPAAGARPVSKGTDKTPRSPFSLDEQAQSLSEQAELFARSEAQEGQDWRALAAEYDRLRLGWAAQEGGGAPAKRDQAEKDGAQADGQAPNEQETRDGRAPSRGPKRI